MRRSGIPLHGTARPYIQIGLPLCYPAEFQSGTHPDRFSDLVSGEHRREALIFGIMPADQSDGPVGWNVSDLNGHVRPACTFPCTSSDDAGEHFMSSGCSNSAQHHLMVSNEADIDDELIEVGCEFPGAV